MGMHFRVDFFGCSVYSAFSFHSPLPNAPPSQGHFTAHCFIHGSVMWIFMRYSYGNSKFSLPTAPTGVSNNNNISTINLIIIINTNDHRTKTQYDIIAILMSNAMCHVLCKHSTYIITIKSCNKTMRSALFFIPTFKMKKTDTQRPTLQLIDKAGECPSFISSACPALSSLCNRIALDS